MRGASAGTFIGVVALLLAGLVPAACGDSGGSATPATVTAASTAVTDAAIVVAAPTVLDDPPAQTLCDTLFAAWQAATAISCSPRPADGRHRRAVRPREAAPACGHPAQDCLLIKTAPKTNGKLAAVGDVKMGIADGEPRALDVTWTDAAGLDADKESTKRRSRRPRSPSGRALAPSTGTSAAPASPSDADDAQLALACVRSDKAAVHQETARGSRATSPTPSGRSCSACSRRRSSRSGTPTEFAFLERVLGADAPPGVLDAVPAAPRRLRRPDGGGRHGGPVLGQRCAAEPPLCYLQRR